MSVKVKVPNESMRPASNESHKEMNYTEGVRIGQLRGEINSGNDIRFSLIIAQPIR